MTHSSSSNTKIGSSRSNSANGSPKTKRTRKTQNSTTTSQPSQTRKPRQTKPKVYTVSAKDLEIDSNGKYSFCIPKNCPRYIGPFFQRYCAPTNQQMYDDIIQLIQQHWLEFSSLTKERQPRTQKPRENAELPDEPTPIQPTDSESIDFAIHLTRDFPVVTFEEWKKDRYRYPSDRIVQNLTSIDLLLKHLNLHSKSLPYRAFKELKQTITKIIDQVPQSQSVVQEIIDKLDSLNIDIEIDDEDFEEEQN